MRSPQPAVGKPTSEFGNDAEGRPEGPPFLHVPPPTVTRSQADLWKGRYLHG
jgi:hypothetical protein